MVIVLYAGYQSVKLSPNLINSTGLGGTEQCIIYLANEFAKDGHSVFVTGEVENEIYENVKYIELNKFRKEYNGTLVDLVIGVSYINYLLELEFLNFKNSMFWLHNTEFYPWYRGNELPNGGANFLDDPRLNYIVCLTNWHKNNFIRKFPNVKNKVIVIGNGVSTSKFKKPNKKIKNSFIYTSHSERGLRKVLHDWETICQTRKNATLHISTPEYGLNYFQENFLNEIKENKTIKFYGTLCRNDLYKLMSVCEYWYYPTEYEETFCITALEMLGHNVIPIASEVAALKETLNNFNLKRIDNLDKKINFKSVNEYVKNNDWKNIKTHWLKYIYLMDNKSKPIRNFELDCVYVLALNPTNDQISHWKTEIRTKLLPWYMGPIVCKKATNGKLLSKEWLNDNDYCVYPNWKQENAKNHFWARDVSPGEIGCAISHIRMWQHANDNNFKNILILEEDFSVNKTCTIDLLNLVPNDMDLFYLGRNPLLNWMGTEYKEPRVNGPIVKPAPSYNTHAYILSHSGIKKLLESEFNRSIFAVDEFLICKTSGHLRHDLQFVEKNITAYGVIGDIVEQFRISDYDGPRIIQNIEENTMENENNNENGSILHPDLYSYWDDAETWKQKFISYSARTQEWDLIMDEPFDNCFSMPLFTQEFCQKIREEAEHSNKWTTDRHEYYPTTDMLLSEINYQEIYYQVLREYVMPASIHAFQLDGRGWDDMESEDFLAKYQPNAQGHLSLHHDHSNITALVTLSNFEEYEGGGTYFSHQKKLVKEKQGYVSIHPGNITHKHGARATTSGTRYIIVSFMKNMDFMK